MAFVYRTPGPLRHKTRGFLHAELACTEGERAGLLAAGWFDTLDEAAGLVGTPAEPVIDETSPPTRAELVQKAQELGIEFHHRTGDAKLLAMIEEAMKGE